MSLTAVLERPPQAVVVGMGQAHTSTGDTLLTAVLGSCIGVALYHPRLRAGAMAHVVLPNSEGRDGTPAKYADTAIPHLILKLQSIGGNPAGLVAKIAGGSSMFNSSGPLQIGESNAAAVRKLLEAHRIRILGEHLGGPKGRRVVFDVTQGTLAVQIAGQPEVIL